jgi:hypothetical protein
VLVPCNGESGIWKMKRGDTMIGWSSTSGVRLGALVHDLQGDSNHDVEILRVFFLSSGVWC